LAEYIFIPQHIIFPGVSVTPRSRWPNVWSIDSGVNLIYIECKTKSSCKFVLRKWLWICLAWYYSNKRVSLSFEQCGSHSL